MKEKLLEYKTLFARVPEPLQRQVLARLGFALLFLLLFILALGMMSDWMTTVPFIGLSIFCLINAVLLFQRAVAGDYVVIRGRCVESTITVVRKRVKSLLIDTGEHMVQVVMKQRQKRIPKGAELEIYVANNTQVYENHGNQLLHAYLAINIKGGFMRDDKGKRPVPEIKSD